MARPDIHKWFLYLESPQQGADFPYLESGHVTFLIWQVTWLYCQIRKVICPSKYGRHAPSSEDSKYGNYLSVSGLAMEEIAKYWKKCSALFILPSHPNSSYPSWKTYCGLQSAVQVMEQLHSPQGFKHHLCAPHLGKSHRWTSKGVSKSMKFWYLWGLKSLWYLVKDLELSCSQILICGWTSSICICCGVWISGMLKDLCPWWSFGTIDQRRHWQPLSI